MHHGTSNRRIPIRAAVRRLLPFLALLPFLYACEETLTDTGIDVPYEEELVVQGFLSQGSATDSIWITRTLPPLEPWSIERAAVTDADVVITVDGVEHRLRHTANGHYVTEGMEKISGMLYALRVTSGELMVTATAAIPMASQIRRIRLDTLQDACVSFEDSTAMYSDMHYISANYIVQEKTVYGLTYELVETLDDSNSIRTYRNSGLSYIPGGVGLPFDWWFNTECYLDTVWLSRITMDTVSVALYTYEPAFTSYYETRWNGNDDDLLFGPSGEDPDWNVEGDGLGWFFGRAVDYDTLVVMPE